jgi:hypothetical protein
MKHRAVMVLALLVASSCGSSTPETAVPATAAPVSTEAPDSSAVETTAVTQSATVAPTTTAAPTTTQEPIIPTPGAADTFSADHLSLGSGSWFESADQPDFVEAVAATWLTPQDVVLGVVQGGEAVAFPVDQMSYHHIANTTIGGLPYLVTY